MAEESGPSSKLDNLTKDELVKLVKKYIVLQKQLKNKNEDLTNKLSAIEQANLAAAAATAAESTNKANDNEINHLKNDNNNQNTEQLIKELNDKIDELQTKNKQLEEENSSSKIHTENLNNNVESLNKTIKEYELFKIELEPQLENARREIELNKSMLDMLNNEIQLLNTEKLQLEKKLLIVKRNNSTPSVIVEEDEEDLEEEKRNDLIANKQLNGSIHDNEDNYCNETQEQIDQHNRDVELMHKVAAAHNHDGILILNKQIEDLTFYVDELKSELEAEREKNNEYLNEIKTYRKQIEDFEEQHNLTSDELRNENERLQKELVDALLTIKEKEKQNFMDAAVASEATSSESTIKLENTSTQIDETNNNNNNVPIQENKIDQISNEYKQTILNETNKIFNILISEVIEKQNYKPFELIITDQESNRQLIDIYPIVNDLVLKLKENFKLKDDLIQREQERIKYVESHLERVIKDFKDEINTIESKLNDKQNEFVDYKTQTETKLKTLQADLDAEREKHRTNHSKLEKYEKEASKNKMLDLEIADYERSIKSLNVQLISKDREINDLKNEINGSNERLNKMKSDMESIEKDKELIDEKCTKLKQLLIKAKKDVSDAKLHEAEHINNESLLKAQLESSQFEIDKYKLQLAGLTLENQKTNDKIHSINELNQRTIGLIETKLKSTLNELDEARNRLNELQVEYENYKLKVQHAFKKQKEQNESTSHANSTSELQKYVLELEQSKQIILKLNEKLDELNEKIKLLEKENELLQEEYGKSLDRNTKLLAELKDKENEWKIRNLELSRENTTKFDETNQTIRNLKLENETLSTNFREKIKQLNMQNLSSISLLQSQLEEAKQEIEKLNKQLNDIKNGNYLESTRNDSSNLQFQNSSVNSSVTSPHHNNSHSSLKNEYSNNFILKAIEQTENHSLASSASTTTTTTGDKDSNNQSSNQNENKMTNKSKTLEQLLNEPFINESNQYTDSKYLLNQMEDLRNHLSKGKLQLEHLNELLNESELNNARLTEQINVLKEEIRRLERNQEREKSISNLEYLKNVIFKFLTFSSAQEKAQLLPVLTTMLKLSQEEQNAIMNAKVTASNTSSSTESWSTSFFPKWT